MVEVLRQLDDRQRNSGDYKVLAFIEQKERVHLFGIVKAEGAVQVAQATGRQWHQEHACCSIKIGSDLGKGVNLKRSCAA